MTKRIIWLGVTGLMALSLVLASCAPKVTEEKKEIVTEKEEVVTEKKEVVTEKKEVVTQKEGAEMVVDALGRLVPKPQYGGVLNVTEPIDPQAGWSRTGLNVQGWTPGYLHVTNEPLLLKDRLKGPGGSGEWDGLYLVFPSQEVLMGGLAESWEVIQPDTLKFKIRKEIHWQDKAPTYGAELTAEDVVYTFMTRWSGKWATFNSARMYPALSNLRNAAESIYLSPDDPRTVVFKSAPGLLPVIWETVAQSDVIVPRALGPIDGEGWGDWRGVVGTGPMLLTDYVRGSSLTFARNPNYWLKDQFHPQNQLPYLDGLKIFIIADLSTQQAALRTGKIDILLNVELEDWESLMRTNPELQWKEHWAGSSGLAMRNDRAPFNDVRVRQAMMLAINHDEIVTNYYKGKAEKFYWPAFPYPEHKLAYRPLEEMPQSVQELYGYHPDKAKKLLAEAGYPNGFTTSVVVSSAEERNIDLASVVAAYWAKVGVTLKIDVREPTVMRAMQTAKTYESGIWGGGASSDFSKFNHSRVGPVTNWAMSNEPLIEQTFLRINEAYFNWAELSRIQKEAMPELQMLVHYIRLPLPQQYNMWQPWVKSYHGEERGTEYIPSAYLVGHMGRVIWIDQKLKKAMGR